MEGRGVLCVGPIEGRFVGESIDFRAVVGAVLVPRVDLPDTVDEPSCLVGDLVGDLLGDLGQSVNAQSDRITRALAPNPDTGPDLAAGVGLSAFMLCLFVAVVSSKVCLLAPPVAILGGLPLAAAPLALPFGRVLGLGVDSSTIVSLECLINMPCPGGHLKYR